MDDESCNATTLEAIAHDGALRTVVRTTAGALVITDERTVVLDGGRIALDMPISNMRRAELVVERGREATVVLVPDDPRFEVQAPHIADDAVPVAANAIGFIASSLARPGSSLGTRRSAADLPLSYGELAGTPPSPVRAGRPTVEDGDLPGDGTVLRRRNGRWALLRCRT